MPAGGTEGARCRALPDGDGREQPSCSEEKNSEPQGRGPLAWVTLCSIRCATSLRRQSPQPCAECGVAFPNTCCDLLQIAGMRVSLKLSIALCCASVVVIGSHGAYQLRQEATDLQESISRELRLTGTAVQVAVENAARDGQAADIRETLQALERIDPVYDIFVFGKQQQLTSHSGDQHIDLAMLRLATESAFVSGRPSFALLWRTPVWLRRLRRPLRDELQSMIGTVALVRPLDDARRDLRRTGWAIAASVLALVVALAGLCCAIGAFYVGTPLGSLLTALRLLRRDRNRRGISSAAVMKSGPSRKSSTGWSIRWPIRALSLRWRSKARRTLEVELQRLDKLATLGGLPRAWLTRSDLRYRSSMVEPACYGSERRTAKHAATPISSSSRRIASPTSSRSSLASRASAAAAATARRLPSSCARSLS